MKLYDIGQYKIDKELNIVKMIKNFAVMRLLNKKFLKQDKEAQMEVFLNPKN